MSAVKSDLGRLRIVKKLLPSNRGAITLAEQFGETLVCVRHRVDAAASCRYTTVELVVSKTEIKPKHEDLVAVRIAWGELHLARIVKAAGAEWDPKAKVWRMPRRLVGALGLTDRLAGR